MKTIPLNEYQEQVKLENAREEGLEEGIEKGIEKGIEQNSLKIARSMLADGLSADLIKKYTGRDEKEILAI